MLTLETLITKLRKELIEAYQQVADSMIAGGVKDYEQYKYLLGQAHAYKSIDSALTEILKPKKEKKDGGKTDNIVQFGRDSED